MANNNTPDFDFDDEDLGPKALRDFAKAQKKQNEELQAQLKTLQNESRTRTVQSIIKEKGLPEKVAKLVPADADPEEFLTEYGDIFGITAPANAEQAQQAPVVNGSQYGNNSALAQDFAQFQAMQQLATNQQSAAQANPQLAALEKAGLEGGTAGITDFMRSLGITA